MDIGKLEKANMLQNQIKVLDYFVFCLDATREVKLTNKKPKLFFGIIPYGAFESKEIECSGELAKRLKDVVRQYKKEIEEEFKSLE